MRIAFIFLWCWCACNVPSFFHSEPFNEMAQRVFMQMNLIYACFSTTAAHMGHLGQGLNYILQQYALWFYSVALLMCCSWIKIWAKIDKDYHRAHKLFWQSLRYTTLNNMKTYLTWKKSGMIRCSYRSSMNAEWMSDICLQFMDSVLGGISNGIR